MLLESQSFDLHIQRVVGQGLQQHMGADIRYVQMLRIELSRGLGDILTVETNTRVSDDKGVDTQVEWGMTGGVLGGQRIDDELEIGLR